MTRIIIALLALAGANIASSQTTFSALTALATPADGDLLAITDVSDTGGSVNGTTKKITLTTLETWFHSQAVVISGVWEVQDDTEFNFGNDADWNQFYDSTAEQLEFSTTAFNGSADGTGMFRIRVNDAAGTIDADQTIFEIVDNATDLFSVDAEGDVTAAGDITVTNANATNLFLTEKAANGTPGAGKSEFWGKNTAPTTAFFTDDTDADFQLATLTGTETLTNKTVTGATIDKTSTHAIFTEKHSGASHTLTAAECYGGVYYLATAHTLTLPAAADGMSLTVIVTAAVTGIVDSNAADLIVLDGTALDDGDSVDSTGTAGSIIVFTYYDATGWYAASDGWVDGGAS